MRNSRIRNFRRLTIFSMAFFALMALDAMSNTRAQVSSSVNIANNSSRQIIHVYLSHVGVDDWSGDQLGGSVIGSNQSFTLSNFACDQQQIKVIGEDQDGCFLSTVVACGADASWTITNDSAADCGQ
ncbi:MAG: hypothetical protein JWM21_4563 [Acidobacteria bacterium]|jgi:hypothetical protein|nr:hypothetical protein [Acidobacteriota bacterium]